MGGVMATIPIFSTLNTPITLHLDVLTTITRTARRFELIINLKTGLGLTVRVAPLRGRLIAPSANPDIARRTSPARFTGPSRLGSEKRCQVPPQAVNASWNVRAPGAPFSIASSARLLLSAA